MIKLISSTKKSLLSLAVTHDKRVEYTKLFSFFAVKMSTYLQAEQMMITQLSQDFRFRVKIDSNPSAIIYDSIILT
jgi:hypothetical protein